MNSSKATINSKDDLKDKSDLVLGSICVGLLVSAMVIGQSVATGVMLGLGSTLGLGFFLVKTYFHAPEYWNWIIENPIKTDLLISLVFIGTIGQATLGGMFAACAATIFSSGMCVGFRYIGKNDEAETFQLLNWESWKEKFLPKGKVETFGGTK